MTGQQFIHSEQSIIDIVARHQKAFCTSYDVLIPNCFTQHDNEADLFAIRKSGLCDEFEVKVTRSDFFNDAKKIVNYRDSECFVRVNGKMVATADRIWCEDHGHLTHGQRKKIVAPWQKLKYDALVDGDMPANYFWYILKKGIVTLDEVPSWAGVFFIDDDGDIIRGRQPTKLHGNKLSFEERFKLCRKTAYRFWEYRIGNRK